MRTTIARGEPQHAEIFKQAIHGSVATTFVEPGILLLGIETERHCSAKSKGRIFADVVITGSMATFHGALLYGIQNLQGRDKFSSSMGYNFKMAVTHLPDPFGDGDRAAIDDVK